MKYVGSKNRIAKELIPIIQSYVDSPSCKGYIEPFVGGANIIDKINAKHKYGLDAHKYLVALLNQVKEDTNALPYTISKETYDNVRKNMELKYEDWFIGLVGFCASYNGKWFGGYANNVKTKIGTIRNYTDESIKNLKKQAPNLKNIIFYNKDFREIKYDKIYDYVIYCDPPYKDTTKYSTDDFPYDDFYDWCRKMSENNIVLISEYKMPSDFVCIWQKELKCTLDNNSRKTDTEKLFIYKSN